MHHPVIKKYGGRREALTAKRSLQSNVSVASKTRGVRQFVERSNATRTQIKEP